ncbi:MAG: tRNA 2-thiouridine(34) synthase MnmA [Oscillospiraceae bacterium]|nr:tRNA 2-thiouridine(34) synthase MnmA [Oscillospiraceae bacterium]
MAEYEKRVLLGLSGGVDSAVSARLLQRAGYEVLGLYLDISETAAREDAISTADFLGVPLTVLDISAELEENVNRPFCESYLKGRTPNPCILCNPSVKFRMLREKADEMGCKYIATGHYARTRDGGVYRALSENDQSYMLCRLKKEQAENLLLPLGELPKSRVRELAEEFGIPVAHKPDSMEICFIPDKDYASFIGRRAPLPPPGDMTFNGEVIGQHRGIHTLTVGQRIPGLYNERKLYVDKIKPESNEIILALWEGLFKSEVRASEVSWLIDEPASPFKARVKVRHTKWEMPLCTVTPLPGGEVLIETDEPFRAPAPGQAAAFYVEDRLVGGGIIV